MNIVYHARRYAWYTLTVMDTFIALFASAFAFVGKIIGGFFSWIFALPKGIDDWFKGVGMKVEYIYTPVFILFLAYVVYSTDIFSAKMMRFTFMFAPFILPSIFLLPAYKKWMAHVQSSFSASQGEVLLEVIMPKDVFRSPEAMEQVFAQLYQSAGLDNPVQGLWDGKCPPSYSFEIVSREGMLHFYIMAPRKKFKNMIEAHLYAQYPGIEVREVAVDYTAEVPISLEGYSVFGFHFGKKTPVDKPIRTYVEWGHLDFPDEEQKIDPLNTLLEAFGNAGPGEQLWLQILIEPNKKHTFASGSFTDSPDWKADGEKMVKDFMSVKNAEGKTESRKVSDLSDYEKKQLSAMQRQLHKYAFNTTIRGLYVAKKGSFNGDRIALLGACLRGLEYPGYSGIGVKFSTSVPWPWWQDVGGKTVKNMISTIFKLYRLRSVRPFGPRDTHSVLSTEELATLWHVPSRTVSVPGLERIGSVRREAPSNLPI